MCEKCEKNQEIIRNIVLSPKDIKNNKFTKFFFQRLDVSEIKKELIRKNMKKLS